LQAYGSQSLNLKTHRLFALAVLAHAKPFGPSLASKREGPTQNAIRPLILLFGFTVLYPRSPKTLEFLDTCQIPLLYPLYSQRRN
jgi:hypothetical protein